MFADAFEKWADKDKDEADLAAVKQKLDDARAKLAAAAEGLSMPPDREVLLAAIKEKVQAVRSYIPKVGIFGDSGVGKSSLCNALFGREIAKISDVAACTREPQEILIGEQENGGGIVLVDIPGIGEDLERHAEYSALYQSLAPNLDLVLWAVKADDRNYQSALDVYPKVFRAGVETPVVFVITQIDKTNPIRDWDIANCCPGEAQKRNIVEKEAEVSAKFDISMRNIISISAEEGYNLRELVDRVVEVLPNEKKYSFAREAKEEVVSDLTRQNAERGVWDSVKEFVGDAWESVKEVATDMIVSSASKFVGRILTSFKFW
ncbi:GTPase family protein [Achromobacter insolitus]|uniref:GTPase family protein n=1 Tax=Achromobacter insolitus TaxID=217204 RepID=UPI000A79E736|nr:GTPase [Achromobacter insolitus]AVG41556.1 GTP-binding protein [Achromobacter insolitus]